MSIHIDDLRGVAQSGWPVCDLAADEIEELERQNRLLTQMLDQAEKEVEKLREAQPSATVASEQVPKQFASTEEGIAHWKRAQQCFQQVMFQGDIEAVRWFIEHAMDYHDIKESEADGCDMPESAKYHEGKRLALKALLAAQAAPMEERRIDHKAWTNLTDGNVANLCEIEASRLNSRCDINKNFAVGEPFARSLIAVLLEAARRLSTPPMNNGTPK